MEPVDRYWEEALVSSLPCESVAWGTRGWGVCLVGACLTSREVMQTWLSLSWTLQKGESKGTPFVCLDLANPDIVDIKPANMEDLTEVITASEFHPHHCNLFVYSSSKGSLRLCDMRAAALCDKHSKRKSLY